MTISTKKYTLGIFLSQAELARQIIEIDSALKRYDALLSFKKIIIKIYSEKLKISCEKFWEIFLDE